MPTVRSRIMDDLIATLGALEPAGAAVGLVLTPASPLADRQQQAHTLAANEWVVLVNAGDDEVRGIGNNDLTIKSFPIVLYAMLPEGLITEDLRSDELASEFYRAVVAAMQSEAEPWSDLPTDTTDQGGGGVGYDENLSNLATTVLLEIDYRHTRSNLNEER